MKTMSFDEEKKRQAIRWLEATADELGQGL
jgi:hypothetical protein